MKFIVIHGDLLDGFDFVGPFESFDDAKEWIKGNLPSNLFSQIANLTPIKIPKPMYDLESMNQDDIN